jgi:hypothetical protein
MPLLLDGEDVSLKELNGVVRIVDLIADFQELGSTVTKVGKGRREEGVPVAVGAVRRR